MEYTSRLQMKKPEPGDQVNVDDLNENFDKLDQQSAGPREVTSTARPVAPYVGQKIWETDTKQERLWNGTTWIWAGGIRPFGRLRKVDGFQNITSTDIANPTAIRMGSEINRGGVTDRAMSGDATLRMLVVPETGVYRVAAYYYISGGSPLVVSGALRVHNASNAFSSYIQMVSIPKPDAFDQVGYMSLNIEIQKDWSISLAAHGSTNAASTHGISSSQGTMVEITYEGPLP